MIIVGSLDITEVVNQGQNFEQMVNNERKTIKRLVDKIAKYKPSILFVEKSINRLAIEFLLQQNISVV